MKNGAQVRWPGLRFFVRSLLIAFLFLSSTIMQGQAMEFLLAGAPRPLVKNENYSALFALLQANKIAAFLPTFQYQEIPEPRSFGFESDFVAPCSANDPPFRALRRSSVKLLVPGELIYPDAGQLSGPIPENDPLVQLISCVGRDQIYGITNYDEAAFHGRSITDVQRLYERVKAVDPSLTVLMVHGPLVMDRPEFSNHSKRQKYLHDVVRYSRYADIVGFDVYPVPGMIAKLATPLSNGEQVETDQAVPGYLKWMSDHLPEKRKLMVLQGFAYTDMYEFDFLKSAVPYALRAIIQPPDSNQLETMLAAAEAYEVEAVIWWGQAALRDTTQAPWPDILKFAKQFSD
ncbi:hypothetical protein [Sneathiella sp.]|jgi:hypothetical protein|uniref:hypothetical protein n=1 Tax=Sneathiella sp. TaxID=1964365 RepID=UPI0039E458A0